MVKLNIDDLDVKVKSLNSNINDQTNQFKIYDNMMDNRDTRI